MDDALVRLVNLLDDVSAADSAETVNTSLRLPVPLRDAAVAATELGFAASATELAVRGLRDVLEAFAQRAILDEHYRRHPQARPTLAEVALATAELDGNPLAQRPELIARAAEAVARMKDEPTPDDVLLFAAGIAEAA